MKNALRLKFELDLATDENKDLRRRLAQMQRLVARLGSDLLQRDKTIKIEEIIAEVSKSDIEPTTNEMG